VPVSENGWSSRGVSRIVDDMVADDRRLYRALAARDARFDGVFFVGVTSTGIYCRPICPARTPKASNCRFFRTPPEAEQAGFRPCLRCRPELAPGSAPVDDAARIAALMVERLEAGGADERRGLEAMADEFELSSRQVRRIVRQQLGVAPIQLLLTRRLLLAKQLLTDTPLPVTEIAFASGFASLRRFNDAFTRRYGMPPTRLRRRAADHPGAASDAGTLTLRLVYRPPYDWPGILDFLRARAFAGVEHVTATSYARTVRIGASTGWLRVTHERARHALVVEVPQDLAPALPALLRRVRALFDLDARPDVIARHLRRDPRLAPAIRAVPGLRVPGAFNGFELGVRAILGQQVTVKGATTLCGRLTHTFGDPVVTPFRELCRLPPTPTRLAEARPADIARHGIVGARARSLVALANAHVSGAIDLDRRDASRPDEVVDRLVEVPGIGPWTAQYIAMRALAWPDAFPKEDIAVRRALGGVTAARADVLSAPWRPWRSYAVMHLWRTRTGASSVG
jgi:AraC family transcriptional regulator of adaptative response / DNA-3-methyladenine glycosylase II